MSKKRKAVRIPNFRLQGRNWQVGSCPPSFWLNRRRVTLLLAHTVLGSQLRTFLTVDINPLFYKTGVILRLQKSYMYIVTLCTNKIKY